MSSGEKFRSPKSGLAVALILLPPALAFAAAAGEAASTSVGPVLFALAVLVLCAKAGGLAAQALGQASVLGELLVGISLANLVPPLLGADPVAFIRGERTITVLAEVGVLILLFDVGLGVDIVALARPAILALGGVLLAAAIAGKLVCSLAVLDRGPRRLAVGIGMIPRGEVGLIFAGIGAGLTLQGQPLLGPCIFSAIVLMVLVTTLLAPLGLRWVFTAPAGSAA
jgi:Kef-type K+ transport system membrane component KefB